MYCVAFSGNSLANSALAGPLHALAHGCKLLAADDEALKKLELLMKLSEEYRSPLIAALGCCGPCHLVRLDFHMRLPSRVANDCRDEEVSRLSLSEDEIDSIA